MEEEIKKEISDILDKVEVIINELEKKEPANAVNTDLEMRQKRFKWIFFGVIIAILIVGSIINKVFGL
jgi:hypothetical protein